jgi:hypothetical protein
MGTTYSKTEPPKRYLIIDPRMKLENLSVNLITYNNVIMLNLITYVNPDDTPDPMYKLYLNFDLGCKQMKFTMVRTVDRDSITFHNKVLLYDFDYIRNIAGSIVLVFKFMNEYYILSENIKLEKFDDPYLDQMNIHDIIKIKERSLVLFSYASYVSTENCNAFEDLFVIPITTNNLRK